MNKIAIVLHGIRVKDGGKGSVAKTSPWLKEMGYDVLNIEYGRLSAIAARWINGHLAQAIASNVRFLKPRLIVSHSNGSTLEYRALQLIEGLENSINLLRIAPALDRNLPLPACVHRCTVFYNAHDWVVRLSEYVPFARWGSMGAFGPDSADERFIRRAPAVYRGHSSYFGPDAETVFRPMFESSVRRMEKEPCDVIS